MDRLKTIWIKAKDYINYFLCTFPDFKSICQFFGVLLLLGAGGFIFTGC